jgi:hypothetical protein
MSPDNWEKHFRGMRPGKPSVGCVGFGAITTPGDVLAYRNLWDPYVVGTLQGINQCGDVLLAVSANPPAGISAQTLVDMGNNYHDLATKYLAEWNQFAGLQDIDIVAQGGLILTTFQDIVQRLGKLRADPSFSTYCVSKMPDPPSLDVQKAVLSRIEGLGILAHGVLQFFVSSETEGLKVVASDVGKGAKDVIKALPIPWYVWVGAGLAVVWIVPKLLAFTPAGMLARRF